MRDTSLFISPIDISQPITRFLNQNDIPQLLELENEKWEENQAASASDFSHRITSFPDLCFGAFCPLTGRILSSVFLKPVAAEFWKHVSDWDDCTHSHTPEHTTSLFGISAGSRDPKGADALSEFIWFNLIARGWKDMFMGSPIPGWSQWHEKNPDCSVEEYVMMKRADGLPYDPQLRYYNRRGLSEIICVKDKYFPHERSHDYGVILRCVFEPL